MTTVKNNSINGITLTGDVTGTGANSIATSIASNAVANSQLAQMPTHTLKGNNTGVTANVADLTVAQVQAMLGFPSSVVGLMFNFQQGQVTTPATFTPNAAWVDITSLSVAITPTSSSNKVLVRSMFTATPGDANNVLMFRFVRASTTIGVGTSVGSRTAATTALYTTSGNATQIWPISMEWLDSPATTSATTYKVQVFANNSTTATTATIGSTGTDSNTVAFPRTVATISVCEVST